MKTHLVKTLSITLLLSIPCAMHAAPTKALIQDSTPVHPKGLNPFEQRDQLKKTIGDLEKTIDNLKKQRDGIEPKKNEITLASSVPGGIGLSKAATQLAGLDTLAASTAKLLAEKEALLAAENAKMPALEARIQKLQPSEDKLEAFKAYQTAIHQIQSSKFTFKHCATTNVPAQDDNGNVIKGENGKTVKVSQPTIAQSDKSGAHLPTKEEYTAIVAERQKAAASLMNRSTAYVASFIYTKKELPSATNRVKVVEPTAAVDQK